MDVESVQKLIPIQFRGKSCSSQLISEYSFRHMGFPLRQDQRVGGHGARAYQEHQKQGSTTAKCRWSELDGWFTQPHRLALIRINDVKGTNI